MSNIGFIGLGIMGRPMAGHLLTGGHTLFVHDIAPVPQAILDAGATACTSGAEVARRADIIITMVPDTPHVEAALFGPGGVAEGLTPRQGRGGHEQHLPHRHQGHGASASTPWAATTWTPRCPAATWAPRPPA